MFAHPSKLTVALLMMITSAVCWGSWANTFKGVKNYRFELFYWDYAIGIFLISLILGHTMGSSGHNSASLINNIHAADTANVVNALIGGALFNLANLLLVAAIDMVGLAVAFPISIGIALVVGTVLSYALEPKGNSLYLALGVACAFVAVVLDGKAYGSLASSGKNSFQEKYRDLRRLGRPDGTLGSVHDSCHDARKLAGPLQRRRFSNLGCVALLLHLEHLFHEASAGWRTRKPQRIF